MLRSLKDLIGYTIQSTDGEIGKVADFYFDDLNWVIRYMIADTGSWLEEKLVLISPFELGEPDWNNKTFPVKLTKQQIENSPDISIDAPVSRQHEEELSGYYGWPQYWSGTGGIYGGVDALYPSAYIPSPVPTENKGESAEILKQQQTTGNYDPHLRSLKEVEGYKIHASDGKIGHVQDFISDDETWIIRYMLVDTHNWLPGGSKVLIAPFWIESINWDSNEVTVSLTIEKIKDSPELDTSQPINRQYETELFDYYSKPGYWKK
jgi:uncharacterized protein YrrD